MMSEISYHQQQYIRHQKRGKRNLFLFLRIFILHFLSGVVGNLRQDRADRFILSSAVR